MSLPPLSNPSPRPSPRPRNTHIYLHSGCCRKRFLNDFFMKRYHGGWVAPNIYFLGHAGCVQVDGIRIAGASGIYNPKSFGQGLSQDLSRQLPPDLTPLFHHPGSWETLPYDNGSIRSVYHIREYNVRRLSLVNPPVPRHKAPSCLRSRTF